MCVYVFIGLFCFVLFIKILFINLINLGIGILLVIVFIELYNWFFNLIKIKEFYKYKWFLC